MVTSKETVRLRLTCCQVVTMRMDGPGRRTQERGEETTGLQRRISTSRKLSRRDGSTLMRATISLLLL